MATSNKIAENRQKVFNFSDFDRKRLSALAIDQSDRIKRYKEKRENLECTRRFKVLKTRVKWSDFKKKRVEVITEYLTAKRAFQVKRKWHFYACVRNVLKN